MSCWGHSHEHHSVHTESDLGAVCPSSEAAGGQTPLTSRSLTMWRNLSSWCPETMKRTHLVIFKVTLTFAAQDGGRALDQLSNLLKSPVSVLLHHRGRLKRDRQTLKHTADRKSLSSRRSNVSPVCCFECFGFSWSHWTPGSGNRQTGVRCDVSSLYRCLLKTKWDEEKKLMLI